MRNIFSNHFQIVDRPDLPSDYEANAWNRLERAVHAIQRNQPSPESLEVLYQVNGPLFFLSNMSRNNLTFYVVVREPLSV